MEDVDDSGVEEHHIGQSDGSVASPIKQLIFRTCDGATKLFLVLCIEVPFLCLIVLMFLHIVQCERALFRQLRENCEVAENVFPISNDDH